MVRTGQDHEPGWLGGELNGKVGWFPEAYVERADAAAVQQDQQQEPTTKETKARVLFDFKANESTELSITKGDTVTVTSQSDPNWWYGIGDQSMMQGYFPSNYVTSEALEPRGITPTDPPEIIGSSPKKDDVKEELCVALYAYNSEEPGDLTFDAGETITILKKDADWWTGKIGDRTGVFPFNYVEPASDGNATKPVEVSKACFFFLTCESALKSTVTPRFLFTMNLSPKRPEK